MRSDGSRFAARARAASSAVDTPGAGSRATYDVGCGPKRDVKRLIGMVTLRPLKLPSRHTPCTRTGAVPVGVSSTRVDPGRRCRVRARAGPMRNAA